MNPILPPPRVLSYTRELTLSYTKAIQDVSVDGIALGEPGTWLVLFSVYAVVTEGRHFLGMEGQDHGASADDTVGYTGLELATVIVSDAPGMPLAPHIYYSLLPGASVESKDDVIVTAHVTAVRLA